jgi:hypothetical protein
VRAHLCGQGGDNAESLAVLVEQISVLDLGEPVAASVEDGDHQLRSRMGPLTIYGRKPSTRTLRWS